MAKIEVSPTGCWLWIGGCFDTGYGAFRDGGKQYRAHIWAWEHFVGPRKFYPPHHRLAGRVLPLDHYVCSTRNCVNPAHLRQVTDRENVLRSNSIQAQNAVKTHCIHGHEFTPANTYFDKRGSRNCRACHRIKDQRRRSRNP